MITALVEAIAKLLTEFTWRHLVAVLLVLLAGSISLLGYERYTSSFRLSRIEASVRIVQMLQALDTSSSATAQLASIRSHLVHDLADATASRPLSLSVPLLSKRWEDPKGWLKMLFAALPWLALLVLAIVRTYQGMRDAPSVLGFLLLLAIVQGTIGFLLPTVSGAIWINYAIVPVLGVVLGLVVIFAIDLRQKARERAQSASEPAPADS